MSTYITCHGDELELGGVDDGGTYDISYTDGTTDTITISGLSTSSSASCISSVCIPPIYGSGGSGITLGNITTGTSYYSYNPCHSWSTTASNTPTVILNNDGIDIKEGGDIKVDGHSLKEFMTKMEERLAILVPDPKKMEKFAALKKAYDNYKLLEKLCQEDDEPKQ